MIVKGPAGVLHPAEGFAWACIECQGERQSSSLGSVGQIIPFWEVLPQQPRWCFHSTRVAGAMRVARRDPKARVDAG